MEIRVAGPSSATSCMSARSFFDTNILIYADDRADPAKQKKARSLIREGIREGWAVLSTQVLQEYFVTAVRKLKMDPEKVRRKVELYATQPLVVVDADLILQAIDIHRLHHVSFWDCLIISAAKEAKCKTLYTEDLQTGQSIRGLKIKSPF